MSNFNYSLLGAEAVPETGTQSLVEWQTGLETMTQEVIKENEWQSRVKTVGMNMLQSLIAPPGVTQDAAERRKKQLAAAGLVAAGITAYLMMR
jgi:hypothetical protein